MQELSHYFSDSYLQARAKIQAAARLRGLTTLASYTNPCATADDGSPLTTDVYWKGPRDARTVLLVSSALHGIEGYAGSAIQLKHMMDDEPLPPGVAVVYAHALNPWGFDRGRRVNESNVDLNRNFRDWLNDPLPPKHRLADKLQALLLPEQWNWTRTKYLQVVPMILRQGMRQVQAALQGGTYHHPNGIFYGGTKAEWTNTVVRDIIAKCAAHADEIVHVDIHTGLGKRGAVEMILPALDSAEEERARAIWGDEVKSTLKNESASVTVTGSINFAYDESVRRKCNVTMLCAEFGTIGKLDVLRAMAMDNFVRVRGGTLAQHFDAAIRMREAFAPQDPAWQHEVVNTGTALLQQALRR